MNIKKIVKRTVQNIDEIYLSCVLTTFGDRPGVRGLLFHTVFPDNDAIALNHIHPQQRLTLANYRQIFEYFLEHGYKFIDHKDLTTDLCRNGRYIYVTFDDGYYNNVFLVPLLEELNIPIHMFVATSNILGNKKYWWDVVYQMRTQEGAKLNIVNSEIAHLKQKTYEEIRIYVIKEFGQSSLRPLSDIDRPLNPQELRSLSKNRLITIGSHTHDHEIATNVSREFFRQQVDRGKMEIEKIIGSMPKGFAFPNGNYRREHVKLLRSMNIDFGFSGEFRNNRVARDLVGERRLTLGRFCISGGTDIVWQSRITRAGVSPFLVAQKLMAGFSNPTKS